MKTAQKKSAKTSKKKILKALAPETRKVQNFKATPTEIATIKRNAQKYAGGNVAHWVRHSAMMYRPSANELT